MKGDEHVRGVTCSAPGKVLIAGGYLVLSRPNIGLTIATSSKFHTTTAWKTYNNSDGQSKFYSIKKPLDEEKLLLSIVVYSPQFNTTYKYKIKYIQDKVVLFDVSRELHEEVSESLEDKNNISGIKIPSRNPYIETCITYSITLIIISQKINNKDWTLSPKNISNIFPDPLKKYLHVKLEADNSFYSQRSELQRLGWPETVASLRRLPPCRPLQKVNKTGLGSSAALVTSFVASMLSIFNIVNLPTKATLEERTRGSFGLEFVHRVAQVVHIVAQGKVGSGFDVCAACFGSNRYVRCNPEILWPVLNQEENEEKEKNHHIRLEDASLESNENNMLIGPNQNILNDIIYNDVDTKWNFESKPFGLPESFCMGLGDISAGSSTPSMVRKVKAWRKLSKEEFDRKESLEDVGLLLWEQLAKWNLQIESDFLNLIELSKRHNYIYRQTLHLCENIKSSEWGKKNENQESDRDKYLVNENLYGYLNDVFKVVPLKQQEAEEMALSAKLAVSKEIVTKLLSLKALFLSTRNALKKMGEYAGVPIEPREQTLLCNSTMELPGVLSCSVPGAGGHDAIVAIVLGENALKNVEEHWLIRKNSGGDNVCMMPLKAGIMYDGLLSKQI
eukprot:g4194.t1